MDLSVIIVSYNVKYFLEHCLNSVFKAGSPIQLEVFVVDNNSSDDTADYISNRFREVRLIRNTENVGYSRANNQALALAAGEFILFLNPDTIVPENCFTECIRYYRTKTEAGGLGVRMIDGSGQILPESKRGFPTAWNSFAKLIGLSAIFPGSRIFSGYYLGNLSLNENHSVDVLSGAFLLVPHKLLDLVGGFDERFFMYAEDIDLSYRIRKTGRQNLYFAGITIIHFKGESTRKDERYVRQFHKAMMQFVEKHYSGIKGFLQAKMLQVAISLRSSLASLAARSPKENSTQTPLPNRFEGDRSSIEEAKNILTPKNTGSSDLSLALCEGNDYSFQQLIGRLESGAGEIVWIYSARSLSLISSVQKSSSGNVIH